MATEKVNDVNDFILSRDNQNEADFFTEICDYYEYKKLNEVIQLNTLIEIFNDCISILKSNGNNYKQKVILIKNVLVKNKLNDIQKYNFYLIFHIFIDSLLYKKNIFNGVDYYVSWFEEQLDSLNQVATLFYYDFNITVLMPEISHIPTQEQITIIRQRKKEYLLKLSTKDIPANNFDDYCDKQIKILEDKTKESDNIELELSPKNEEEIEITSGNELKHSDLNKPKLTLPDILQNQEMGGVKYAAEITRYSESHIRFLARNRKIPCYKPTKTGHWRFEYSDLQDWMKNGMKNFQTEDDALLRRKK